MKLTTGMSDSRRLSDEQIASEWLECRNLIEVASASLDKAWKLKDWVEANLRQIGDAQQTIEAHSRQAAAAESECTAHHSAVIQLRADILARVEQARATVERLDQMGGPDGLARLREHIEGIAAAAQSLQNDFEQARGYRDESRNAVARAEDLVRETAGHAATCKEASQVVSRVLGPLGGHSKLQEKLAKIDALEVAARKRFLEQDHRLDKLQASVAVWNKGLWIVCCFMVSALGIIGLLAAFLR